MIEARAGVAFTADLDGAPTGLTGTLGIAIEDELGATVLARSTDGIIEAPAGAGIYLATLTAPAVLGSYLIVWDTGGGAPEYATEDLVVTHLGRPSLEDVGALLRVRTTVMGEELGTFTDETRPTAEEAEDLITQAAAEVALRLPDDVPERYITFARHLMAIRTAMLIEISYDPDRAEADGSSYQRLKAMYDEDMTMLIGALGDSGEGTTSRVGSIPLVSPMYASCDDYDWWS